MPAKMERKIFVNDTIITYGDLVRDPDSYLALIRPLFRSSTIAVKDSESYNDYLNRLFSHLYYKRGYRYDCGTIRIRGNQSTRQRVNRRIEEHQSLVNNMNSILDLLDINVVKHCEKNSKIVFKCSGNQCRIKNESLDSIIKSLNNPVHYDTNNVDIKFGVELEFVAERYDWRIRKFRNAMNCLVGETRYVEKLTYNHNEGNAWVLGRDGSVHGRGKFGFELTSPILTLHNEANMDELRLVIGLVKRYLEGDVNRSCGAHIHMSFNVPEGVSEAIKKHFAKAYRQNESALFDRLVPVTRREDNNHYCKSVSERVINDRYRKLNLIPAKLESKSMHIEFRQLDGTLDYNKLCAWIKVQELFVKNALYTFGRNKCEPDHIVLENVLYGNSFSGDEVESLMKMAKIAA